MTFYEVYAIFRFKTFVAYDVCHIMTFDGVDVCRITVWNLSVMRFVTL